ncbi:conserved exported hypothetical protein [Vibrio nigripulchritudo SOn1]|uniref:Uncharacterized protein n=1 Tax=Vibrio nigripulchritudo SOn1 TaxID=1238450 RepID=A0AAV2VUF0_9VIBR|nr:DUF2057 family protein [Vibrio nigripulchritudo]CCO48329.1 conserved exported hypothetical protein [Vibrio nigripulchritudo SOn1]
MAAYRMNLFKTTVIALFSLFSFSTFALDVIPSKGISILIVNGELTENKTKPSKIVRGYNQVVVRLDTEVGRGSGNKRFTSAPYIITFDADSNDVKVTPPKVYSLTHAENTFRGNPEWKLTSNGNNISYQSVRLEGRAGSLPYIDLDELVADYNSKHGISFSNSTLVVTDPIPAAEKGIAGTVKKTQVTNTLSQLQAWYLKASKEERKAFRKWMIDQE